MNIGYISTSYAVQSAELKPAELNSVGSDPLSDDFVSERPVPAIDKLSATHTLDSVTDKPGTLASEKSDAASTTDDSEAQTNRRREEAQLKQEQEEIQQLAGRDREVRAHEQAHAAVGGQYAGAPEYQFQRGPDGVRYAVGGEVSIDVSKAATPEETIRKMQVVRRAALAPADPSPQDRRVAAQAAATEAQARQDLSITARDRANSTNSGTESTGETEASGTSENAGSLSSDTGLAPIERAPTFTPFRSALPPSAITNQLQRSILATQEERHPGGIINQLA